MKTSTQTRDTEVQKMLDESNAQVVATVCGKPTTRGELGAAFDRVRDSKHWKNPIDATISVANDSEIVMIEEAIVFFTGSAPDSTKLSAGRWRVSAAGYFLTCGA